MVDLKEFEPRGANGSEVDNRGFPSRENHDKFKQQIPIEPFRVTRRQLIYHRNLRLIRSQGEFSNINILSCAPVF
jgi:hypothetical protein